MKKLKKIKLGIVTSAISKLMAQYQMNMEIEKFEALENAHFNYLEGKEEQNSRKIYINREGHFNFLEYQQQKFQITKSLLPKIIQQINQLKSIKKILLGEYTN